MILLASKNRQLLNQWKQAVSSLSPAQCIPEPGSLRHEVHKWNPPILLLDHDMLGENNLAEVEMLLQSSPDTRIIISSPGLSEEMEWQLLRRGVRGCCSESLLPAEIGRMVQVVWQGELWVRRKIVSHMFNELASTTLEKKHIEHAVNKLLENLTRREYEIALLVGQGESNKSIARQLDIAERTVKAHLTEIFRKLAISDRIKLALLIKDSAAQHSTHDIHTHSL
ncbi:response regulator transcription factor [Betaproteobacteria bacterium PRO4]|uniref:LuxR C-terminal-related transcriptional regulator n=1 Tax=Nitrosomonas sp. TaxID=42353 RepID=UPI00255EA219|nr:response regulator transcription factor [Nitrosomonas sp.]MDL1867538.1 response regulator transcription factor [Betaproteobacteria bacterium PRO4]